MKMKLSRANVERIKPGGRPFEVRDTAVTGLILRVQPSGSKSFVLVWGRGRRKTLGRYPVMTAKSAHDVALKMLAEAAELGAPKAASEHKEKPVTFGEFIKEHYAPHVLATAKAGKATIAAINAQFSDFYSLPLGDITRKLWDGYKARRLNDGRAPATVNRDLDRIKAAMGQALTWEMIERNPLAGVKRIKRGIEPRVRYLSKAEEKRLRAALASREELAKARRERYNAWRVARHKDPLPTIEGYSDHIYPMTLLAMNTGLRRGEITQLTWDDIDFKNKLLTVRAGYAKSGKERHVPLNAEAMEVLTQWKEQHPEGRLFRLVCTATAWGGLMKAANIEGFRFHDLRHDFASKLVMAGVSLNTVRELLGHADLSMTLRYAHLAPGHMAAAVELLGRRAP